MFNEGIPKEKQIDKGKNLDMKSIVKILIIAGACAATGAHAAHPAYDTLIAHRGESFDAPENTLVAYRMAVERGFGFECDVYLSSDGRVFSFHDRNLKRTTGIDMDCCDASWEEVVSKVDAGAWKGEKWRGVRPALLEEILPLARDGRYIYLEVKTGCEIIPYIKKAIDAQNAASAANMLFISFSEDVCKRLKETFPDYKVFLLAGEIDAGEAVAKLRTLGIDGLDVWFDANTVTGEYAQTLRDAGFELHVWTCDRLEHTLAAFAAGAQSVTTNCAQKQLDEYLKRGERQTD